MESEVELKLAKLSHAKRHVEILDDPNFLYFWDPPSLRQQGLSYFFSIFFGKTIVGGCGLHVNYRRKYIAEIGFFVDHDYWGRGIATNAVRQLEWLGFNELELERIEMLMDPRNSASERVAVKCGFQKEGLIRNVVKIDGNFYDALLYAKVK